jgi:hypothetical protein
MTNETTHEGSAKASTDTTTTGKLTAEEVNARFARLDEKLAAVDEQLERVRAAVARLESRATVAEAGVSHVVARIDGHAHGPLHWLRSADTTRWTAALPDGRLAVVERLGDGDAYGNGASFLPRISAFGKSDEEVTGPVVGDVLSAARWIEDYVTGDAQ